ncbi:MAG TPA: GDSL-type esterase/lipase family protein [Candidatus Limnocylindrales bacterium]|jgi:lysophospholipase L1-like esterase|nr:GDSL-type esterase/lipase family protein [Candidatus Limnocylindrales bacterium]
MIRRHQASLLAVIGIVAAALLAPAPVGARVALPSSIASTGDSLTRAAGTGFLPWTDNPAGSWSTGTDTSVNSHYLRLLSLNPKIRGRNYNDARSGAKMGELSTQVGSVISQKAQYMTVELGGNDVCADNEAAMTSVADYGAQFRAGLDRATGGLPNIKVFVASVPNIYHLWELYHDDLAAQAAWFTFGVCQSMLANPTSTAQADVDRRARVTQRIRDDNDALASICAQYRQCLFDGLAAFNANFTKDDVGHFDYFHPSLAGQAKFSAGTWAVGYWAP